MHESDFRWGYPLCFARPCCDSGKRTKVAIASASFWLGGVAYDQRVFFQIQQLWPLFFPDFLLKSPTPL